MRSGMLVSLTSLTPRTRYARKPFGWNTRYVKKERPRKGVLGESRMHVSGYRYYSPSLGRWANRDPISEKGGNNLHAFCRNRPQDATDRFGLWPGYRNCSKVGLLSDSGWGFMSIVPDSSFVGGGSTGGGTSDGAELVYKRTIVHRYKCVCCKKVSWAKRTFVRGYAAHVDGGATGATTGLVWNGGIPGTWPPIVPGDFLVYLFGGLVAPTPAFAYTGWPNAHKPPLTQPGALMSDTGIPRIWCWW